MKRWGLVLAFMILQNMQWPARAADNMVFHGALVAEPCTLRPGDEDISLDFGPVIDKYLYSYGRTQTKRFELVLQECDISLGNTVKVTFSGTGSTALPGLLALNDVSQASGIALGIETGDGKPVPLNKAAPPYLLSRGGNVLQFQAYIQGEPQAIAQKKINPGAFSAVATFAIEYQ